MLMVVVTDKKTLIQIDTVNAYKHLLREWILQTDAGSCQLNKAVTNTRCLIFETKYMSIKISWD